MRRARAYIITGLMLNVLYAAIAITSFCIAPRVEPQSFAALRSNIEQAANLEDLRPRARNAVTMLESGDRALVLLYGMIIHSFRLAVAVTALNILILCLAFRAANTQHDQ